MKSCCTIEAQKNVKKGREVAICDTCGAILMGYDNQVDFQRAIDSFTASGVGFEHTMQGKLWVIAKQRRGSS